MSSLDRQGKMETQAVRAFQAVQGSMGRRVSMAVQGRPETLPPLQDHPEDRGRPAIRGRLETLPPLQDHPADQDHPEDQDRTDRPAPRTAW